VARVLLDVRSTLVAWVIVVGAFAVPRAGFGVEVCPFHAALGLPCPGCGLTRSITALAALDVGASLRWHPFGPLVFLLALALVAVACIGARRRSRVASWLVARERGARVVYLAVVYAFIAFGVGRIGLSLAAPHAFGSF